KIGRFSLRAFSRASGPQAYQSTGLWACCFRYGLDSWIRRFVKRGDGVMLAPGQEWAANVILCRESEANGEGELDFTQRAQRKALRLLCALCVRLFFRSASLFA